MIKIIAVGKIKEKSLKKLIDDYVERISYYSNVKIIEVSDEPNSKKTQEELIKNIEGQRVLKHIKDNDYVYLLDLNGKEYDSLSFSKSIDDVMTYKSSDIVFVIGGSLGLSDELIKRSDIRWKLSNCTFPHQIVRLLLVEQIYRAFSILNNLPYHK